MNANHISETLPLRMPIEHGAWGILLVPFLSAAGVAGRWNAPLLLVGVCALGLFLLRGSITAQLLHRQRGTHPPRWKMWLGPAHLLLSAVSAAAALGLLFFYRRDTLFWVGLGAAALYLLQRGMMQRDRFERGERRSLPAELVGVALLTLTAPAAWIAARGSLEPAGVKVWLLNLLFFLGGVLYVKYRVRGLLAHRNFRSARERLFFAWPVFFYHLLLAAFLTLWVFLHLQPAAVLLAFVPGILRANGLLFHLGRRFAIPRLGWNEVLHAAVFAAGLILVFRL